MEIFVRLFVWILNHTYRRPKTTGVVEQDPMVEVLLREHEEQAEAQRKDQIVAHFKSDSALVHGVIDYDELKWESFFAGHRDAGRIHALQRKEPRESHRQVPVFQPPGNSRVSPGGSPTDRR